MTIYFATRKGDPAGAIKIGHTSDVSKRMSNLEVGSPDDFVVLATAEGGREVEDYLHEMLGEHRIAREWYRRDPTVLRWVEQAKRLGRLNITIPADTSAKHQHPTQAMPGHAALQMRAVADTFGMSRAEAAAFLIEKLAEQAHRGPRVDTWSSARDRAAKAAGVKPTMAKRIWQRWRDMKDVSGEALFSLMVAYEAMCASSKKEAH